MNISLPQDINKQAASIRIDDINTFTSHDNVSDVSSPVTILLNHVRGVRKIRFVNNAPPPVHDLVPHTKIRKVSFVLVDHETHDVFEFRMRNNKSFSRLFETYRKVTKKKWNIALSF